MSAVLKDENAGPSSVTRKLSLHAVLPQQALLAQLESGLLANPSEPIQLLNAWDNAYQAYGRTGPGSRSFLSDEDVRTLQGIDQHDLDATLQRIRLYSPFNTHRVALCQVNISKLVTPQITINRARAALRV